MSGDDPIGALADRLEALGDELSELAIDELRGAIRSGGTKRPEREKRITQARRAIDKAVHLLRSEPGAEPFDDGA